MLSLGTNRRAGTLDLGLTAVVTILAAVVLLVPVDEPTLLRAAVGLPLLLFLPGYAVAAALFPARAERTPANASIWQADARAISGVERLVLSVVASVAILGGAGIVASPIVGVRLAPILGILVAVTLLGTLLAFAQRLRLPETRRAAPVSGLMGSSRPLLSHGATGWFVVLAGVLALLVVGASGVVALGPDGEGVTEFYVGGEVNGTIAMGEQPTELAPGEQVTHYLVVGQRGSASTDYTVVAQVASGPDAAGEDVARHRVTINGTDNAVQSIQFSVDASSDDTRVRYYLYEGSAPENPSPETALRYLSVGLTVSDGS